MRRFIYETASEIADISGLEKMNILFVCSANVSRSFFAEMLLRHELSSEGIKNVDVLSAGLLAYQGSPPDPKMLEYLLKIDVPVTLHESRQITGEDVGWADRIIVMERGHAKEIKKTWPGATDKVELLGRYISAAGEDNIVDPFGRSSYHYRLSQSQIRMAIKNLVKQLLADRT
ncbi:MAG: low molecular weight protein arginine phosphatase [Deltaproteobacteria bacterium]|nr:low molecular weight protein arginine phosphatase [Deltaproteobacteria bacterium]